MLCICVCATENRVGMTEKCCLFSPPPLPPLSALRKLNQDVVIV